ncbi:MAG TPA: hypothetical protein VKF42_03745 [Chitinivibrionales bacterium]|jgi:hypothetical protein|nr:hypothetical protein [Chitinivibrionales bacterium]
MENLEESDSRTWRALFGVNADFMNRECFSSQARKLQGSASERTDSASLKPTQADGNGNSLRPPAREAKTTDAKPRKIL